MNELGVVKRVSGVAVTQRFAPYQFMNIASFMTCERLVSTPVVMSTRTMAVILQAIRSLRAVLPLYLCITWSDVYAQTQFDLETGSIVTAQNDVRIPGEGGTLFSLKDDLIAKTSGYLRLRINHTFRSIHTLSLLYAPLTIESTGSIDEDIFYNGTNFSSGTSLRGTYQFNSYRLSYRYHFINTPTLVLAFGVTAKIRDANIVLISTNTSVDRPSVGVVPLPHFYCWWGYAEDWGILLEGDAYAGPGGRAIDVQIATTYDVVDEVTLRFGYRILDGGASNERVYGFARFHYGVVGFTYSL